MASSTTLGNQVGVIYNKETQLVTLVGGAGSSAFIDHSGNGAVGNPLDTNLIGKSYDIVNIGTLSVNTLDGVFDEETSANTGININNLKTLNGFSSDPIAINSTINCPTINSSGSVNAPSGYVQCQNAIVGQTLQANNITASNEMNCNKMYLNNITNNTSGGSIFVNRNLYLQENRVIDNLDSGIMLNASQFNLNTSVSDGVVNVTSTGASSQCYFFSFDDTVTNVGICVSLESLSTPPYLFNSDGEPLPVTSKIIAPYKAFYFNVSTPSITFYCYYPAQASFIGYAKNITDDEGATFEIPTLSYNSNITNAGTVSSKDVVCTNASCTQLNVTGSVTANQNGLDLNFKKLDNVGTIFANEITCSYLSSLGSTIRFTGTPSPILDFTNAQVSNLTNLNGGIPYTTAYLPPQQKVDLALTNNILSAGVSGGTTVDLKGINALNNLTVGDLTVSGKVIYPNATEPVTNSWYFSCYPLDVSNSDLYYNANSKTVLGGVQLVCPWNCSVVPRSISSTNTTPVYCLRSGWYSWTTATGEGNAGGGIFRWFDPVTNPVMNNRATRIQPIGNKDNSDTYYFGKYGRMSGGYGSNEGLGATQSATGLELVSLKASDPILNVVLSPASFPCNTFGYDCIRYRYSAHRANGLGNTVYFPWYGDGGFQDSYRIATYKYTKTLNPPIPFLADLTKPFGYHYSYEFVSAVPTTLEVAFDLDFTDLNAYPPLNENEEDLCYFIEHLSPYDNDWYRMHYDGVEYFRDPSEILITY